MMMPNKRDSEVFSSDDKSRREIKNDLDTSNAPMINTRRSAGGNGISLKLSQMMVMKSTDNYSSIQNAAGRA